MDSSQLVNEDKLASIRRRNKFLIITFFSLIIILALITGRTITSLVQEIHSKYSLKPNPAIREFCSSFVFQPDCVNSLSPAINPPPDANPNHVFLLSLESSLTKISNISSTARSELVLSNCSSSLTHAASQLSKILEVLRIDPDVGSYDRGNMTAWIGAAAEDLAACAELGKVGDVADVAAVVGYSRVYLANYDVVNAQFVLGLQEDYRSWRDEVVENLMTVSLFGSQYLVLIFLFCLLLRIY